MFLLNRLKVNQLNKRFIAHAALLATNIIYGVNYSVAKGLMPDFLGPFAFIFCRVLGALLLFWLFHVFFPREKIARKDFGLLIICGFFGIAANQLMFFYGLNLTTPINAAIIMTCNPILVLIMSAWLIRERVTSLKIFGIILGLSGALGLILSKNHLSLDSSNFLGDLFIFLNASSYAVYLVLVKPLMKKYRPLTVIKWVFLFGFVFVLPFGLSEIGTVDWMQFTPKIWAAFAFVIICTTFIAYLFNVFALTELNPSVVSIYIYSQPLVATIVALIFQQDHLDWRKVIAAIFIFAGVFLVSFRPAKRSAA